MFRADDVEFVDDGSVIESFAKVRPFSGSGDGGGGGEIDVGGASGMAGGAGTKDTDFAHEGKALKNITQGSQVFIAATTGPADSTTVTWGTPFVPAVAGFNVSADDISSVVAYGGNKIMVISDPAAGKVLGSVPTGAGTDGVAFDDGYAFSANGGDSNITMVGETSPGKFEAVATIATTRGARTIAADQKAHKLYLPAAEFGPPPAPGPDGKTPRPQAIADSFQIVVVGR